MRTFAVIGQTTGWTGHLFIVNVEGGWEEAKKAVRDHLLEKRKIFPWDEIAFHVEEIDITEQGVIYERPEL